MADELLAESFGRRIAPKSGYATSVKAQYRSGVWSAFAKAIDLETCQDIVMLPSSEGLEIGAALSEGVTEDRIIAIDMSADVLARAGWRHAFPAVRSIASKVGEADAAIRRMGGVVSVANLDLCGTVSATLIEQVSSFVNHVPIDGSLVLGLTIAKGREDSLVAALLGHNEMPSICADSRLDALVHLAIVGDGQKWKVTLCAEGSYVSGHHPMAWCVIRIESWDWWSKERLSPILEQMHGLAGAVRFKQTPKRRAEATGLAQKIAGMAVSAGLSSFPALSGNVPDKVWNRYAAGLPRLFPQRARGLIEQAMGTA